MSDKSKDIARPRFFMDAVQNMALSEKEGRPIFENKEMVEIRIPGDKLMTWVGEVDEKLRIRFPEHYAAFKRGEQRAAIGTPLEEWPQLTKARCAELKAAGLLTVEELSNVPDNTLGKLGMNAREEREKARAWLNTAKEGAGNAAMAARIAQLEELVSRLNGTTDAAPEAPKDKALEECSDDELKSYIKRVSGEGVRGQPSRETLLKRAAELAGAS